MKKKDVQLIREIQAFLDEHLYEEHSIVALCRQFTVNREKLQTGFREQVHSTVHAYIIRKRMDKAAQRLLTSDESIKAIALESGYRKQRSFNKTFKAIFNLTPAAYRRTYQMKEDTIS
jgi:AraC-like DNA-binding protein